MAEPLAEDFLVLDDAEMVAIVVAAEMEARRRDRRERFCDLPLQAKVGSVIDIGDAVAEVDHRIRLSVGDEAAEFLHQRQGRGADLGEAARTMMDIGDEGEAEGAGHDGARELLGAVRNGIREFAVIASEAKQSRRSRAAAPGLLRRLCLLAMTARDHG